jgi:hypothetical protein
VCDISPGAGASGKAPDENTPTRRHAKALRHLLFCVPARIVRTARRTIMRLAADFPHFEIFAATYLGAIALCGPSRPGRSAPTTSVPRNRLRAPRKRPPTLILPLPPLATPTPLPGGP